MEEYLRNSQWLADQLQRPITPGQLQAEMERMASHTRQPEVLRELFAALGNDPFVVAECLARPVLAERVVGELHAGSSPPAGTESLESRPTETGTDPSVTPAQPGLGYYLPEITSSPVEDPTAGCVDSWNATTTDGAPAARYLHTAVWTGSEMIVWGGEGSVKGARIFNTGGRYNPSTDSWIATSTNGAPSARFGHTAVWTGTEMIVWGGASKGGSPKTGGRYNPTTDSWVATNTTRAPQGRTYHTAVWTGTEMIVWGGENHSILLGTGSRYNPTTDSWVATPTTNSPTARQYHTAVWTGSVMIIWGGIDGLGSYANTGSRYNPSINSWVTTNTTGAPDGRIYHTAVWTGSEMIVWGGQLGTLYLRTGGRYNPTTDSWVATNTDAPLPRSYHTAVWSGTEMIIWGGENFGNEFLNEGGRYEPSSDTWVPTTLTGVTDARRQHTAVWTGSEMIVWGGLGNVAGSYLNTGSRYTPCTESAAPTADNWTPTDSAVVPARSYHTGVDGQRNDRLGRTD